MLSVIALNNLLVSISFVIALPPPLSIFFIAVRGLTWRLEEVSCEFVCHIDVAALSHLKDQAQHEAVHAAEVVNVGRVHEFLVELDGCRGK